MTTIITSLKQGKFADIQQLITEQIDLKQVNQADEAGFTALYYAVKHGWHEVVEALLIAGANPNLKNDAADVKVINNTQLTENFVQRTQRTGHTQATASCGKAPPPTSSAAAESVDIQLDIMQTIITELQTIGSSSALHLAVKQRDKTITKLLLEYGADPNIIDAGNCTPLHWAAVKGFTAGSQLLLEFKADPNRRDLAQSTALHEAIRRKHLAMIKLLLNNHADPNLIDLTGNTPWQLADDNSELLEVLVTHSKHVPAGYSQH